MNTLKKAIMLAALLAALGYGIYEAYQASQLREHVQTLEQLQDQLTTQVDMLQREKEDAIHRPALLDGETGRTNNQLAELLGLRGEVARLRSDSDELARLKTAQEKERKTQQQLSAGPWIKRLNQLQQYLAQHPGEAIPEMQFAEMSAWLNSIQSELETEDALHNASFMFRNQAQMKFTGFIGEAVRQFEQANNGQFPTDLSQLLQYSDPAVGSTMLDLYEIVPRSVVKDPAFDAGGDWIITRKATVNPGSPLDRHLAVVQDGRRVWYEY
jgi:hypothetical protein